LGLSAGAGAGAHTPQLPPSLLQCLQYLQLVQAVQLASPEQRPKAFVTAVVEAQQLVTAFCWANVDKLHSSTRISKSFFIGLWFT